MPARGDLSFMPIRIALIDDIEKNKKELAEAWRQFAPGSIPEGLALDQLLSWWERYGHIANQRIGFNKRPLILLLFQENELRGILPFMKVDRFKKKVLRVSSIEFLTQSFAGSYLDLIHDNMSPEEVEQAFKLIRSQFKYDLINLCYCREGSLLLKVKAGCTGLHAGKVVIPLHASYEKIRSEVYSKNLRHVLNKFRRRISESGQTVRSEVIEGGENIKKLKAEIRGVSLSKLCDPGMHSLYQDPELGELYFDSIIKSEKPFCSVYVADDRLLSYNMGYIKNDVVYAYDAAYDRQYAEAQKIGLGILAYDNLVAKYAAKYRELDMGFGLDDYKFRFSKHVVFTYSLLLKGNTVKSGMIYKHMAQKQRRFEQFLREKVKDGSHDA